MEMLDIQVRETVRTVQILNYYFEL